MTNENANTQTTDPAETIRPLTVRELIAGLRPSANLNRDTAGGWESSREVGDHDPEIAPTTGYVYDCPITGGGYWIEDTTAGAYAGIGVTGDRVSRFWTVVVNGDYASNDLAAVARPLVDFINGERGGVYVARVGGGNRAREITAEANWRGMCREVERTGRPTETITEQPSEWLEAERAYVEARRAFAAAAVHLTGCWEQLEALGNQRSPLATVGGDKYPFTQSFDDLTAAIREWAEEGQVWG